MIFFAGLVLFLFSFAIGPDAALLRQLAGGLLWVGIAFTGTLSLSRTYQTEELAGGIQYLRLYPGEIRAILGENAARIYGFDMAELDAVAGKLPLEACEI